MSLLLENSLDLYRRCFAKSKIPNTNQFLRLCEDLRQAIESLLLLGIGLNPQENEESHRDSRKAKIRALKDYIDRKLVAKVELDKHVIEDRLSAEHCRIITRDV